VPLCPGLYSSRVLCAGWFVSCSYSLFLGRCLALGSVLLPEPYSVDLGPWPCPPWPDPVGTGVPRAPVALVSCVPSAPPVSLGPPGPLAVPDLRSVSGPCPDSDPFPSLFPVPVPARSRPVPVSRTRSPTGPSRPSWS